MAKKKVSTSSNGRPYIINAEGRSEFISFKAAAKLGWEKPRKSKAPKGQPMKKPAKKPARR